jgi:lipoate-protein ligase A
MTRRWRLILEDKCDGYYNMAADEAIFLHYPLSKTPTLRLYGWKEPFISLGYNQEAEKVLILKETVPFVRRITGGAAILHDKELTYSLCCSQADLNLPGSVKESYKALCSFLKEFYRRLGLEADFAKDSGTNSGGYTDLCFCSCEQFDLLIGEKKIGGNAQRRRKNIIFQHGSIPLEIDFDLAKKLFRNTTVLGNRAISLREALGRNIDFYQQRAGLAESFKNAFGIELILGEFSLPEKETTGRLLVEKYRLREWNFLREKINVNVYSAN